MVQLMYFALLVVSFLYVVVLLSRYKNHISVYYILLAASVVVVNLGFLQMASATTEEGAIMGNLTTCLAAPFTLPFDVAVIADLCKTRVPLVVKILCTCVSCALFLCALTSGFVDWYYQDTWLVQGNGYVFLAKDYGPLHKLYPAYITAMMFYSLGIVIFALRRRTKVSHFVSVGLMLIQVLACAVYLGERMLGIQIELMPLIYVVCVGGILLMLNRVASYDVSGIARDSIEENNEYGFVICDKHFRFCSADNQARQWFPELNSLRIDYKIDDCSTDFLKRLRAWVVYGEESQTARFVRDGRSLELTHSTPKSNHRTLHCAQICDNTQQQRYLDLVEHYNDELEEKVEEKTDQLERIQNNVVVGMASIVEGRDGNTGDHIRRTSDVVRIFVSRLLRDGDSDVPGLTRRGCCRV